MSCAMCGATQMEILEAIEAVAYKGEMLSVPMVYTLCRKCGHEFVNAKQIKANDKVVLTAKRKVDGLLTPVEIRQLRRKLGLTQAQAAVFFGGGRNAFSKYERGEVAQSEAMDKLLRLCNAHPSLLSDLANLAR